MTQGEKFKMNNQIKKVPDGTRPLTLLEEHVCQENGYHHPVVIQNSVCAIQQFFTTVAIVVGISDTGYSRRYCFHEYQDATHALLEWVANPEQDHPGMEWIKLKGVFNKQAVNCVPEDLLTKVSNRGMNLVAGAGAGARAGELKLFAASSSGIPYSDSDSAS